MRFVKNDYGDWLDQVPSELPVRKYDVGSNGTYETLLRPSSHTLNALKKQEQSGSKGLIGYSVVDAISRAYPRFMSLSDAEKFKPQIEEGRIIIVDYVYSRRPSDEAKKLALLGYNANQDFLSSPMGMFT